MTGADNAVIDRTVMTKRQVWPIRAARPPPKRALTSTFVLVRWCRRGEFHRYPTTPWHRAIRRDKVNSGGNQRRLLHETEPISDRKSKSYDFIFGQSAAVRDRTSK